MKLVPGVAKAMKMLGKKDRQVAASGQLRDGLRSGNSHIQQIRQRRGMMSDFRLGSDIVDLVVVHAVDCHLISENRCHPDGLTTGQDPTVQPGYRDADGRPHR